MSLAEFRINVPAFAQQDDIFSRMIRHFNIQATDQLLDNPELRDIMLAGHPRGIQDGQQLRV